MTDRHVEGVDLDELEEFYKKFEDAVSAAIVAAMRASIKDGAIDAGSVAAVSLDDLNVIPGQWARQVPALAEDLAGIYVKSADMQADAFVRAGGVVTDEVADAVQSEVGRAVRRFTSEHEAALDYLKMASNRLVGIGDDLWADARAELLLGMDAGDSVPQLARRVREATGVTDQRARIIARTECLPGDATVTAARATAIYRRWYEGEWTTVRLGSGHEFSGTPNHPVLTSRGWVALGELSEGDHLIYDRVQVEGFGAFGDHDGDDRPPTIGELFDAASKAFVVEGQRGTRLDFHGDGSADSDVEVVRPDGVLLVGDFAPVTERRMDLGLECADLRAVALSAYRAPFRSLLPVDDGPGLDGVTPPDSGLIEDAFDDAIGYAEAARDALCRSSRLVLVDDGGGWQVSVDPGVVASGVSRQRGLRFGPQDAGFAGEAIDGVCVSAGDFLDSSGSETGGIEGDDVVSLSLGQYSGHVYNLTTIDGYYNTGSYYTGNCVAASNGGSIAFMRSTGEVATKAWLTRIDGRERPAHRVANGQEVDLEAKFMVGGVPMDHPGDPNAPVGLTAACRCTMRFGLTPDADDLAQGGDTLAASALEDAVTVIDESTELDTALVAAMDPQNAAPWEGVICVTGTPTGDRRQFDNLTWADLPLPLRRNVVESHGGVPQTQAVLVGRIDTIEMRANEVWASGVIDLGSDAGRETARLMGTRDNPGFLRGVSIDGDEEPGSPSTIEYVFPADCGGLAMADGEPSMDDMARCMEPELSIWSSARIRGATLTDIAALTQANLYLTEAAEMPDDVESYPLAAAGDWIEGGRIYSTSFTMDMSKPQPTVADVVESLTAAAHSVTLDDVPPRWFFDEPADMPEIGGISVTDDGRFFGYVAPVGVAHRGIEKRTTVPLRNVDYSRWATRPRAVANEDGTVTHIATGPITMGCNHADTRTNSGAIAREHYENSCSIVATACIGENRNGVWIAGALMPDITAAQIARILACQLSGDWRAHKELPGKREFAGALLVSVPGFPVANRGARVSMQGEALVASAVPVHFAGEVECVPCQAQDPVADTANAARAIAASCGWDRGKRAREIYLSVKS